MKTTIKLNYWKNGSRFTHCEDFDVIHGEAITAEEWVEGCRGNGVEFDAGDADDIQVKATMCHDDDEIIAETTCWMGLGEDASEIPVAFLAGESRHSTAGVNYMHAKLGDGCELYAEEIVEDDEDEAEADDRTYGILKAEIIRQAKELGINPARLKFWWD